MISRSSQRIRCLHKHVRMYQTSSQSADDDVLINEVNDKRIIILNRPEILNALNRSMIRKIYHKMVEWETDPSVSMVLIKGAGGKAFCSGGDLKATIKSTVVRDNSAEPLSKEEYLLDYKIATYTKPYVSLIDGITMGSGGGLAVHGKFQVATERTVFAMPEIIIGMFPNIGAGYFFPRLKGRLGIYLGLMGFRLKGRDVHHAGLATHFVQAEKLPELEQTLMQLSDASHLQVEKVLNSFHDQNPVDKDKPFSLAPHLDKINTLFNQATVEDIFQQLEADGSEWALQQLKTLKKMSPTSLKVSLRYLQMGETLSLAETLQVEYRVTMRRLKDHDFREGVHAVVVDKDHNPKWFPDTLEGVTTEKLDWYFSPLPQGQELVL